jgi:hypothetical protein
MANGADECEFLSFSRPKTVQINVMHSPFHLLNASANSLNYSNVMRGKNRGIISVGGCKRGVVGPEISPSLAAVKIDDAFANRGRVR